MIPGAAWCSCTSTASTTRVELPLQRHAAGALLAGLMACVSVPAAAHPHAWIDLETTPRVDMQHGLIEIEQRWVLDPSYSVVLLEDQLATQGDSDFDTALASLAGRLHERLAEQQHLTEVRRDGEIVAGAVSSTRVVLEERRLVVEFVWRIAAMDAFGPSASSSETAEAAHEAPPTWSYRVYDPEYWIEILHHETPDWQLAGAHSDSLGTGDSVTACRLSLDAAEPDPRWVTYAAQLDRTQSPGRTEAGEPLGRLFSDRVKIHCNHTESERDFLPSVYTN